MIGSLLSWNSLPTTIRWLPEATPAMLWHGNAGHTRQLRGHPAAGLQRHLADRNTRHHVEDGTTPPTGEVARSEIGPVPQPLGCPVDRFSGARGDLPTLSVVEHIADRRGRHTRQAGHIGGGGPGDLAPTRRVTLWTGHAIWWHDAPIVTTSHDGLTSC